jgi:hypothetical protein
MSEIDTVLCMYFYSHKLNYYSRECCKNELRNGKLHKRLVFISSSVACSLLVFQHCPIHLRPLGTKC